MIRPGPPNIVAGACPGGVVIHVYAATDVPVLLFVRRLSPDDSIEDQAARDAVAAADVDAVCLVAYDGDTGQRFDADQWMPVNG